MKLIELCIAFALGSCVACSVNQFPIGEDEKAAAIRGAQFLKAERLQYKRLSKAYPEAVLNAMSLFNEVFGDFAETLTKEERVVELDFELSQTEAIVAACDRIVAAIEADELKPEEYDALFHWDRMRHLHHQTFLNAYSAIQEKLEAQMEDVEGTLSALLTCVNSDVQRLEPGFIESLQRAELDHLWHRRELVAKLRQSLENNPLCHPEEMAFYSLFPEMQSLRVKVTSLEIEQTKKWKAFLDQPEESLTETERTEVVSLAGRIKAEFDRILSELESCCSEECLLEMLPKFYNDALSLCNIGMPEALREAFRSEDLTLISPKRAVLVAQSLQATFNTYLPALEAMLESSNPAVFTIGNVRMVRNYAKAFDFL